MKVFCAGLLLVAAQAAVLVNANAHGEHPSGGAKTTDVDTKPKVNNGGVNLSPYSPEIRDYIVEQHNSARSHMVPSEACNMRQVSWDESLAIEAAELVETCVFEHDTEDYAYGQNLMYGGDKLDKPTVESWMKAWVEDEISDYDRNGDGMMDLDHASAVLWANTYLVGCASKMCPNGYLTACNYFNPGNWQGEKTFIPGKSCSNCPSQAPYCDVTGKLCTANPSGSGPAPAPVPTKPTPGPEGSSNAPVTKAPVTPFPSTKSPVTPCPTSGAPVSGSPVTPCPTTVSPASAAVTPCPSNSTAAPVVVTPCPSTPAPMDHNLC